jgi:hypothetical protein
MSLTSLILRLRERGARFNQVVAAGGVIRHQPILFGLLANALRQHDDTLTLSVAAGARHRRASSGAPYRARDALFFPAR